MAFHFGKKKQVEKVEVPPTQEADREVKEVVTVEKEKVNLSDPQARLQYVKRLHEGILEADKQCENIKFEYGQVTSYLKDIQILDQAPEEEKKTLKAAAFRIVDLTKERAELQKRKYKITNAQEKALERFEDKVGQDLPKLKEYEDYQIKIKNDLRQLSSEKALLIQDQSQIVRSQKQLKSIGKILTGILVAMGAMLLVLAMLFKVDITVPFVAAAAFAFVVAAIILNESRKNRIDMVITEKKRSRAIALSNRVKIKYVNNVNTVDYMCHKYQVRNGTELEFVYGEYLKAKREWERQKQSSVELHDNSRLLMQELARLGVKDTMIWCSQAEALVNPKEMVEVRHDLRVRRQKLREQVDYNTKIKEECLEEIEKIQDKKPEYAREIQQILGNHPVIDTFTDGGKEN